MKLLKNNTRNAKNRYASIDIGLNNLAKLTFNQTGIKPKSDKWQIVKIYQSVL